MKIKKLVALLSTCVLAAACMTGCGNTASNSSQASDAQNQSSQGTTDGTQTDSTGSDSKELSGSIQMVGSTSMEKLANALAESFMEK